MARRPIALATCLLVPFVILMLGVTFAVIEWSGSQPKLSDESGRGPLPPGFSANIQERSKHAVWLHSHTVFEGETFESRERLPDGADVIVIDETTNKTLELSPLLGQTVPRKIGGDVAIAIGTFHPGRPGPVTVKGRGFPKPVILSVAPINLAGSLSAMLTLVGILIISIFLSLVSLIVLLHRRKTMIESEQDKP